MRPQEGAIRKRRVPDKFRSKNARVQDILEWARGELNGVEPDLGKDLIERIKSGEVTEVFLRPKKHGFFLPGGEFVEAFDFQPSVGGDLDEAEKQWESEEDDNAWAEDENKRFNKRTVENHDRIVESMWEHGRRIVNYANEHKRSVSGLLHRLDRRKGPNDYARHTHQTCLDLYRWLPNLQPSDIIFDWNWERIDSILRFSNNKDVRDHLLNLLRGTNLRVVPDDRLSRLLGRKRRKKDNLLSQGENDTLGIFRKYVAMLKTPTAEEIDQCISIVSK